MFTACEETKGALNQMEKNIARRYIYIYNTRQCQIVGPPLYPVDSLKHLIIFASSVIEILRHINAGFTRRFTSQKRQKRQVCQGKAGGTSVIEVWVKLESEVPPQKWML